MKTYLSWGVAGILAVALGVSAWNLYIQHQKNISLETESDSLKSRISELEAQLTEMSAVNEQLSNTLASEQKRNNSLNKEVNDISRTVSGLQKRVETDPELLQKYSKVYFLNEHYAPSSVTALPAEFIFPKGTTETFHTKVQDKLVALLEDAQEDGLDLKVISGYRSFNQQASLKASYRVTYGSGANKFSADQGYSEHQLGTAVDFTTEKIGSTFSGFDATPEYAWLQKNAYKYGFILSYPSGNAYYQYEPWHWRYVGTDLAEMLQETQQHFYDLPQRDIDEYLGVFFD